MIKRYYSYSFLIPGLVIFMIFFVAPSLVSFFYAFTNLDSSFHFTRLVGFANFKEIIHNPDNSIAFKNTLIFTAITTFFKITLGLGLALFVNMKLRTSVYLRSMLFLPVILSPIAVALAFTPILHPSHGILNEFLRFVHLDFMAKSWLTDRSIVMYAISGVEIWKFTGLCMILFLAALQTIPREIIESSYMDGASKWQSFRFITFPALLPVFNTTLILNLIGGLKIFDIVYGLTGGGPGNASSVIYILIYKSFATGRNGEATAANVLLFLLIFIAILLVNKVLKATQNEG